MTKQLHKHLLSILIIMLFCINIPGFAGNQARETQSGKNTNWYDNLFFKDPSFTFEFIRTLGYTYSGGADIGESISTARAIKDGDIYSWYQQWLNTADRIYHHAEMMQSQGDIVSAREAYFRASNYYRTAGLFMVAPADRPKSISAYATSRISFLKAVVSLPYIKVVKIPYTKELTLPGYFMQSSVKNAPLLIIHSGFDGTAEELYFEVGKAAHTRGYNVLLFEGPGQGSVLRQQNLPFLNEWEKVVAPVINYSMTLPNIEKNKIALMGISMGGYLAARACAFDERIKACIVNGGIYSVADSVYNNLPASVVVLVKTDPKKFNEIMYEQMKKSVTTQWFFNNAMWAFNAPTPAAVMMKLNQYTMKDVASKIKSPILIIDSEADIFYKGQPQQLYNLVTAPKTLMKFTSQQAAQAHCQMGAIAISNAYILNWLSKVFQFEHKR
jgi:esterase/lipase